MSDILKAWIILCGSVCLFFIARLIIIVYGNRLLDKFYEIKRKLGL
jgi:hypothetical protein